MDWMKLRSKLQTKPVHIILEGADGAGKSTVARMLDVVISQNIGHKTFRFRNPCDEELYQRIRSGAMTPYEVGIATFNDSWEVMHILRRSNIFSDRVWIQDRSGLISGWCYNVPWMSESETNLYHSKVRHAEPFLLGDAYIFNLQSDRPPTGDDIFEQPRMQTIARIHYQQIAKRFGAINIRNDSIMDTVMEILERTIQ